MAQGQKINLAHFSSRNSLGCAKKRDITFKFRSFLNFEKSSKNSTRLLQWKNHQNDASVKGHTIKTLVKAQKKIHFSLFCNLIREIRANVSEGQESPDRTRKSNSILFYQKIPLGG